MTKNPTPKPNSETLVAGFRAVATPETKTKPRPASGVERPAQLDPKAAAKDLPSEVGGYDGPEPTRFGDWEHKGRCTDF